MRGSRIQAIVRELNNEKIDIVNFSERSEIFITRALSPAKPIDLYIDDDRNYCIAIFNEGDLDTAVGRSGVNINLASKLTGYTIDAYTEKEYEEILLYQKTNLDTLNGIKKGVIKKLESVGIVSVSDYLSAKKKVLVDDLELSIEEIDSISVAVDIFIDENKPEEDKPEEVIIEEAPAEEETPAEEEPVEEAQKEEND